MIEKEEEISEEEQIRQMILRIEKTSNSIEPMLSKLEGAIGVWQSEKRNTFVEELTVATFKTIIEQERDTIKFLRILSAWIHRVEDNSVENRQDLLALLGLPPDATTQDSEDAFDDLRTIFADYRRKKRGQ